MLRADWMGSLVARRFPGATDSRRVRAHLISEVAMIAAVMALTLAAPTNARAAGSSRQPDFGQNVYIFIPTCRSARSRRRSMP